jgi:formylglycine-generating enzyme required for sulfatase activity
MAGALNLLDEAASLADPEEIEAERVETNLAMAWDPPGGSPGAPPSASAPDPVEQTVDAVPPPVEAHADGPASHPDAAPVKKQTGEVHVNALSQTLILIEPGEFEMGSPHGEPLRDEGEWQHTVSIAQAFWISRVEVTRGQFASFVSETRYVTDAERAGWSHGLGEDGRWRQMDGTKRAEPTACPPKRNGNSHAGPAL